MHIVTDLVSLIGGSGEGLKARSAISEYFSVSPVREFISVAQGTERMESMSVGEVGVARGSFPNVF